MARPAAFERDRVIEKSLQVFWRKGYQGTSMRNIGDATKLNPGSLYGSFGNKRALFSLVLECYYQYLTKNINQSLNNAKSNHLILPRFFEFILKPNENSGIKGCLMVNSLLEMANDSEIQSSIGAMFSGLEEMFYWIIVRGQKEGEYNQTQDPRLMAQYLVNNYCGLRVQNMTEKDETQLKIMVQQFLKVLE